MKKHGLLLLVGVFTMSLFLPGCVTIRQGEVGVKRKLGKYSDKGFTESPNSKIIVTDGDMPMILDQEK